MVRTKNCSYNAGIQLERIVYMKWYACCCERSERLRIYNIAAAKMNQRKEIAMNRGRRANINRGIETRLEREINRERGINREGKIKRGFIIVMTLALLLSGLFTKGAVLITRADSVDAFSIQAELMPSDKETYSIRLTIENQGSDWEGTVRLVADESYRTPCAYDTALSLPQGSRKQFVVKIPLNSTNTNGTVKVILLDGREHEAAYKEFRHLLTGQMDALSMGILSDAYSKLTYMDMGGRDMYFYNDFYPVRLVELKQGSLEDELESLTFLVIDQYNTGILTEEELKAIELWNQDGGVLILGTGAYAEDVLSGFDDDYPGFSVSEIHAPGDDHLFDTGFVGNMYVEMSQLNLADLQLVGDAYYNASNDYYLGGWFEPLGNGSAAILPYSFAELGSLDADHWYIEQEDFIQRLLESVCSYANSRYANSAYGNNDYSYEIRNFLGMIGNSNNVLGFGVLQMIIVLYVIFVGPVLYLILRMLKRRELYWAAVPVTALLGIILVFFAGRGFEVVSTKAYSVTLKNLSEDKKSVTYLYCYDADRREWDLKMADGCEYAGSYSSSYNSYENNYYYHIKRVGDEFFLGIKPGSNFEDSYFYLSSTGNDSGTEGRLFTENLLYDSGGISGTVVNNTNKDIKYLAVVWHESARDESMIVFEGLAAGSSCRLEDMKPLYDTAGYYYASYAYSFLSNYYNRKEYDEVSALAALGIGIYHLMPQTDNGEFAVIGVVENWDKTVDDDCSEVSYGCLYTLQ